MNTPLRRTLSWRGRTVAWDRWGSGPALVLLHGTPWSTTSAAPSRCGRGCCTGRATGPCAWLQALIPHASLTVIEGAGHLIQLDAPAQLAAALTRWTNSVR